LAHAVASFEKALAIDDHYAELHFRVARCRLALGETDAARNAFSLARDWDALQFRADSRINEIIRHVAGRIIRTLSRSFILSDCRVTVSKLSPALGGEEVGRASVTLTMKDLQHE